MENHQHWVVLTFGCLLSRLKLQLHCCGGQGIVPSHLVDDEMRNLVDFTKDLLLVIDLSSGMPVTSISSSHVATARHNIFDLKGPV